MPQQIRAVTSASNLSRRKLCPGSARMERDLPEQRSEASTEGTMMHPFYMAPEQRENARALNLLTEEQCDVLQSADAETIAFFDRFCAAAGIPEGSGYYDESEVPLSFSGAVSFPGHADIIRFWPAYQAAAIADLKTGRLDVDPAPDNLQTAGYAVMANGKTPLKFCGVAIIQPRNYGQKSTSAIYDEAGLQAAAIEIENIVLASMRPDAPLHPSEDACRYCKAKLDCPAVNAQVTAIPDALPNVTKKTAGAMMGPLTESQFSAMGDAIKLASMISDAWKAEAMKRIERGELAGWEIKEGATRKEVTDACLAFGLLNDVVPELTGNHFMEACTLSRDALKKPVAELLSIPQAEAERLILRTLEPLIERKQNAPSVVRSK